MVILYRKCTLLWNCDVKWFISWDKILSILSSPTHFVSAHCVYQLLSFDLKIFMGPPVFVLKVFRISALYARIPTQPLKCWMFEGSCNWNTRNWNLWQLVDAQLLACLWSCGFWSTIVLRSITPRYPLSIWGRQDGWEIISGTSSEVEEKIAFTLEFTSL